MDWQCLGGEGGGGEFLGVLVINPLCTTVLWGVLKMRGGLSRILSGVKPVSSSLADRWRCSTLPKSCLRKLWDSCGCNKSLSIVPTAPSNCNTCSKSLKLVLVEFWLLLRFLGEGRFSLFWTGSSLIHRKDDRKRGFHWFQNSSFTNFLSLLMLQPSISQH